MDRRWSFVSNSLDVTTIGYSLDVRRIKNVGLSRDNRWITLGCTIEPLDVHWNLIGLSIIVGPSSDDRWIRIGEYFNNALNVR